MFVDRHDELTRLLQQIPDAEQATILKTHKETMRKVLS